MLSKGSANVALAIYQHGGVDLSAYGSVKEMVQFRITGTALAGSWGSEQHLVALRETKELLDRTLALVEAEVQAEDLRGRFVDE